MHATVEIFVWSLMHYLELRVAVLGEQALTDGQGHVDTTQTASADDRARLVAHERLFKDDIRQFFCLSWRTVCRVEAEIWCVQGARCFKRDASVLSTPQREKRTGVHRRRARTLV